MTDVQQRISFGGAAAVGLLILAVAMQGCQQYGSVSPRTYEIASALYSVCNRKDVERLPVVDGLINEAQLAAEISEAEANWLREIVGSAHDGEWQTAMLDARTMMTEQVTR